MFSIIGLLFLKYFSLPYLNFLAYLLGHCCMSFKFSFSFCVNYGLDKKREKPFFISYLPGPGTTLDDLKGGSLTDPVLTTALHLNEVRNEVVSQNPAEPINEIETGNLPI